MKKHLKISLLAATGLFILTTFHHVYGARVFNTPWRMHIIFPALIALGIITLLYFLVVKRGNNFLFAVYALSLGLTFGLLLGGFEGFYNHLLKNIFFFAGASTVTMETLFPPPTYEMPSNFIFEFTGIMQCVPGTIIIYSLIKAYKALRNMGDEVA